MYIFSLNKNRLLEYRTLQQDELIFKVLKKHTPTQETSKHVCYRTVNTYFRKNKERKVRNVKK